MPFWTREIVPRKLVLTLTGASEAVLSDAGAAADGLQADQARGFIEVQALDGPCELRVYRFGGAAEDAMLSLDASPALVLSAPGVANIEWDEPLPAYLRTRVDVHNTGSGPASAVVFRVLQTCRTRA